MFSKGLCFPAAAKLLFSAEQVTVQDEKKKKHQQNKVKNNRYLNENMRQRIVCPPCSR